MHIASWSLLTILCLTLAAVPAMAQGCNFAPHCYDNGPVNGQVDAWNVSSTFAVSDSFTLNPETQINNISFWAWLVPGDAAVSVGIAIGNQGYFSNNIYDNPAVSLTQAACTTNELGFDVCHESATINVQPPAGNYWLTLSNGVTAELGSMYWDENSGVGCTSLGCPSLANDNSLGTIPSEAFTVSGGPSPTTPEPGSIMLFGSGILGLAAVLRRNWFGL
jgi:hypothetical protein